MSADLQQLLRQIESLTPQEREQVRRAIEASTQPTPEEKFDQALRQMGLVSSSSGRRKPRTRPLPVPVRIEGKPLSESLIEERR